MTVIWVKCRICGKVVRSHGEKYLRHCGIFQTIEDNLISKVTYGSTKSRDVQKLENVSTDADVRSVAPNMVDKEQVETYKKEAKPDITQGKEELKVVVMPKKRRPYEVDEEEEEEEFEEEEEEEEEEDEYYQCGKCGYKRLRYGMPTCPRCHIPLDWAKV